MEGEVVFYDRADLERTKLAPLAEDTTSTLGRLYAAWNARQQRTRDAYEERKHQIWRAERNGGS